MSGKGSSPDWRRPSRRSVWLHCMARGYDGHCSGCAGYERESPTERDTHQRQTSSRDTMFSLDFHRTTVNEVEVVMCSCEHVRESPKYLVEGHALSKAVVSPKPCQCALRSPAERVAAGLSAGKTGSNVHVYNVAGEAVRGMLPVVTHV